MHGPDMRAFIAIRVPAEVKEALRAVQSALDKGFRSASWVRPEAIHLTLKFLGEVEEGRADELGSELENAASGVPPLDLTVEGVGGFPDPVCPRVIWAGINEDKGLLDLQRRVEGRMGFLGFETEGRPFTPHLTLCRIKSREDGRALGGLLAGLKPRVRAEFSVFSVVLFKSVLRPTGAEYTAVKEAALKR